MGSDGLFSGIILSFMETAKERDAKAARRYHAAKLNRLALIADRNMPSKTMGNMRQDALSGRLKRGYNPVYYNDSVAVGTVASERNTIASCIYWMEQEKLKQEGKPYVYVDQHGEV